MKQLVTILFIFCSILLHAQKTDRKLEKKVNHLIVNFKGTVGVYVKDLKTGKTISINADTVFPTASIVKVPIMIGIMDKINRGELTLSGTHIYRDSLLYAGVDILGSFKQDEKIELGRLLMLMLSVSDNTASLWLQSLAGTGTRINEIMDSLGYKNTRVNSRTPGREVNRTINGWGQTTPKEIASIFESLAQGRIISKEASDKMLRLLNRNYFDKVAVSQIPPYATVFTKNGAVNRVRSEVVMVRGKKANYVFAIMTKDNTDQTWTDTNEAWELTRKLSKLLWDYYEPSDKWEPAPVANKFN